MKKAKRSLVAFADRVIFLIFTLLVLAPHAASAMQVWTDHATVKIRPTSPAKPDQLSAALSAAKNEFESFQLVVTADQGNLSGVDVTVGDLSDGHGNLIAADSIMIYKEAFIRIKTPSTIQGDTGEWPDALIPKKDEYVGEVRNAFPFSISAGRNQPVWIEIYVPSTAPAGLYTGKATVTATGQNPVEIPIQLTVRNFTLPSVSTLKTAYAIDRYLLPQGHGLSQNAKVGLIQLYAKANLLHRITYSDPVGPQDLADLSGGRINWGPFDQIIGPFLDGTVTLPGGKLPGNKMTTVQMNDWNHKTDVAFMRDYAQHFKSKGWFDRLFQYTCDEPPYGCSWSNIKKWGNLLHQADPDFRNLVTTSIQHATAAGAAGAISLLVPTIRYMDDKPNSPDSGSEVSNGFNMVGNQRDKYPAETWWYQACGSHGCGFVGGNASDDPNGYYLDWPSYMIDLPAMFSRVMEWESFKYNIQGELYYDMVYAYGQGDPWATQYNFGGNGDGTLYYPGTPAKIGGSTHIPIESIRLKMIREGQEDYEYMNMLAQLGEASFAQQQVGRVVTNPYTWDR